MIQEKLIKTTLLLLMTFSLAACHTNRQTESKEPLRPLCSTTYKKGEVKFFVRGIKKDFKVLFLADSHITIEDKRGEPFYKYSKRMGGSSANPKNYGISNGRDKTLQASLDKAKKIKADMVILGGDIINFPSLASVELIEKMMKNCGLPWMYTSGNHDWHYEGEPGTAIELREKWINKNLLPLYQGKNPLFYSRVLNGINFLMIDNSVYEITKEQLSFLKKEIKKGLPIVLTMHIPLSLPGHNVNYGCGSKEWKASSDYLYKLEGREPWPVNGHSKTTYEFRHLVFNSPNIISVCAGHIHGEALDSYNKVIQIVTGENFNGNDIVIQFIKQD